MNDVLQENKPAKGIILLLMGTLVFTIQNALIKHLIDRYSIFEIVFIRSIAAFFPMLILVHYDSGLASLKNSRLFFNLIRSILLLSSYVLYYFAISIIPLADVVALYYVLPFLVTLLSILFLKERVSMKRWLILLVGFSGVVIMLNPGEGIVSIAIIFPVMSALTYAVSIIMTRQFANRESASVMGFYLAVYSLIFSGIIGWAVKYGFEFSGLQADYSALNKQWFFPVTVDWAIFGLLGLCVTFGFYFLTEAYRIAKSSTIAPFEYSGMIPAVFIGLIFWHEIPSTSIIIGVSVLIASGVYMIKLEKSESTLIALE